MLKRFIRIGLLCRLPRIALRRLTCLLGVLLRSVRTGLAYVWLNRCFMKAFLEVLKVVIDLIKVIRNLLFCNRTARVVHVAG